MRQQRHHRLSDPACPHKVGARIQTLNVYVVTLPTLLHAIQMCEKLRTSDSTGWGASASGARGRRPLADPCVSKWISGAR